MAGSRRAEDPLEIFEAAVLSDDGVLDGARGLATRPGRQRVPVKVVVVNLLNTLKIIHNRQRDQEGLGIGLHVRGGTKGAVAGRFMTVLLP